MGFFRVKLKLACPACGKRHLFADWKLDMILHSRRDPVRKWRFNKMPDNLWCENCGPIDRAAVPQQPPVQAVLWDWSIRNPFLVLIPGLFILGVIALFIFSQ